MSDYPDPIREPRRLKDRIRRKRARTTAAINTVPFDQREIVCESSDAARAQAEQQQSLESDPQVEWIYLRPEETGRWVARRTPRSPHSQEGRTPFLESLIRALISEPPP